MSSVHSDFKQYWGSQTLNLSLQPVRAHYTCSFLKHQVSLSGILWNSALSILSCAPPPVFTGSIALLCVGTGLFIDYRSVQSLLQGEFQRQPPWVLPLWSKPAGEWPAPVPGWCVSVNTGVPESTVPYKAPQNFKACFSAALLLKHEANMTCSSAIYWLLRISLSSGHTLISNAIYGAIIWANTVPVTENPLMMMNSSYWWLQPDPQWWVGGKTLALKLCELLSVSRSEFHKSSRKIKKKLTNECKKKHKPLESQGRGEEIRRQGKKKE